MTKYGSRNGSGRGVGRAGGGRRNINKSPCPKTSRGGYGTGGGRGGGANRGK